MGCSVGRKDVKFARKTAGEDTITRQGEDQTGTAVEKPDHFCFHTGQFIQRLQAPFSHQYRVIKELGSGNFGRVYQAQHKETGDFRAVKEIEKARAERFGGSHKKFIAEVEILSRLDHPNILKIYEMLEDGRKFYVVSELCTGGELFTYITSRSSLSEPIAANIMRQVLSAVAYCHSQGVVHRDIKPENLLLDSPPTIPEMIRIKLIDFGTSTLFASGGRLSQRLGTAYYIAPEVLGMNYDEKCDIWSCGVILYVLLCGFPPFAGNTDEEILRRVKAGKYSFAHESWQSVSKEAKSLIQKMLLMDPKSRFSALNCLADPWICTLGRAGLTSTETTALSLANLQLFNSARKLRQAFLAYISSQLMSKEQEREFSLSFQRLDKNGDGRLSREELIEAYCETLPLAEAEIIVSHILEQVDVDGNGYIDYSEFLMASSNQQSLTSKANLEAAFAAFDRDKSGKISLAELREMLSGVHPVSDSAWADLIRQADQDGDGEIDLAEFAQLMKVCS